MRNALLVILVAVLTMLISVTFWVAYLDYTSPENVAFRAGLYELKKQAETCIQINGFGNWSGRFQFGELEVRYGYQNKYKAKGPVGEIDIIKEATLSKKLGPTGQRYYGSVNLAPIGVDATIQIERAGWYENPLIYLCPRA